MLTVVLVVLLNMWKHGNIRVQSVRGIAKIIGERRWWSDEKNINSIGDFNNYFCYVRD